MYQWPATDIILHIYNYYVRIATMSTTSAARAPVPVGGWVGRLPPRPPLPSPLPLPLSLMLERFEDAEEEEGEHK